MAGRTGTAQVSHVTPRGVDPDKVWYFNRDHAWFAGYAPSKISRNRDRGHHRNTAAAAVRTRAGRDAGRARLGKVEGKARQRPDPGSSAR